MRIEQLDLSNFGSHRASRFEFEWPITLIYAENNGGKSTVCDAIEWVFTGKTRGTDARGAGVEALIFEGSDKMKVSAKVRVAEQVATVVRGVTGGRSTALQVNGEGGVIADRQAAFYALVGGHEGVVTALTRSRAFLDLKHADAKDLLLQVLNVRVDVGTERLTLAQLDTKYQEAFDARRDAKARASAIRVPDAPIDEAPDINALTEQLQTLRDEEKQWLAQTAVGDGRRYSLEDEHRRVCDDLTRVEQSVEKTTDLSEEIAAAEARHAGLEPADGDEPRLQTERTKLAEADGRLPMLERTLGSIRTHSPEKGCVLDTGIPCKTAAKHFDGQVSRLEQDVVTLKAQRDTAHEALDAARARATERDRAATHLRGLRDRQASREALQARVSELSATRDRLHREIAALPPPAQKDAHLEALQQRIARGDQTIHEARAVAEAWTRHRQALEAQKAAAAEVAKLETRVELLGPKGARVQALAASLSVFEGAINDALARFGYSLHFDVDPWLVTVNGRSITRLSESERLRVGLSLQLALADVTGLGFVVIDGADLLDARNRGLLVELLGAFDGQAIVTATRDEPPAAMDGVGVYWLTLQRGETQVHRIGSPVAA